MSTCFCRRCIGPMFSFQEENQVFSNAVSEWQCLRYVRFIISLSTNCWVCFSNINRYIGCVSQRKKYLCQLKMCWDNNSHSSESIQYQYEMSWAWEWVEKLEAKQENSSKLLSRSIYQEKVRPCGHGHMEEAHLFHDID